MASILRWLRRPGAGAPPPPGRASHAGLKRVLGVAITRMAQGFCFAGLDLDTGQWVRPVRPKLTTEYDRALLAPDFGRELPHRFALAVSAWSGLRPAPTPPHVEDWLVRPRAPPRIVHLPSPQELAGLLSGAIESSLDAVHPARQRSLALVRPQALKLEFAIVDGKFDAAVLLRLGEAWFGPWKSQCVLLRAWGRELLRQRGQSRCAVTGSDLRRLGHEQPLVAVGLSRPYAVAGRLDCWPMVVAVLTTPALRAEVDYHAL